MISKNQFPSPLWLSFLFPMEASTLESTAGRSPLGFPPSVQKSIENLFFSSFCHIPIFISSQYVFQSIFYFFSFPQPSAGVSPIGFLPLPKISLFCHFVTFLFSFQYLSVHFLFLFSPPSPQLGSPQWGVLPSNDQTPSTIKSGTPNNLITLQP